MVGETEAPSLGRLIDHVGVYVEDLTPAAAAMTALGFSLTPRGRHEVFKTANHLAVFGRNYIELLAIEVEAPENLSHRQQLALGGGIRLLALPSADLERDLERVRRLGLQVCDGATFGRPVEIGGQLREARFASSRLPPAGDHSAYCFYCHHLTPEFVWSPGATDHPNGAVGVAAVCLVDDQPNRQADTLARALGREIQSDAGVSRITDEGQEIAVAKEGSPSVTIKVGRHPNPADLEAVGFIVETVLPGKLAVSHPALGSGMIILQTSPATLSTASA